jgi:F0F1-type ATP synthase epsilon subunit
MKSFSFTFRTPFETIVQENIEWVSLDTAGGRIQIFTGHATLTDHVPHSLVRFQHGMKEKTYFIRTGILHVNHDTNEVDLHCLFADAIDQTIHTTVKEHMAWIHEQIEL